MRVLDLDLDFFLNKNAYRGQPGSRRLGPEYLPWRVSEVRLFLEYRCALSHDKPLPGRTAESHDSVLDFWQMLIQSGWLKVPFEVVHIDAHPDMAVGSGLNLESGFLFVDPERLPDMVRREQAHPGNYLNLAVACGWVRSLTWITLRPVRKPPVWDADARACQPRPETRRGVRSLVADPLALEKELGVPYKVIPFHKFRTREPFDCIALSRSPEFTPPESDALIPVIEEYMELV